MKKRSPEPKDSIKLNGDHLVVQELFKASDVRWVRVTNKRGDSRYFSEKEWLMLYFKKN